MKNNNDKYLSVFSCCKVVRGKNQGVIIDIQREEIYSIPLDLIDFIDLIKQSSLDDSLDSLPDNDKKIAIEYIEYLIENELAFYNNNPKPFKEISTNWDYPSLITNCLLDYNETNISLYKEVVESLDDLLCYHLDIRILTPFKSEKLLRLLNLFQGTTIQNISLKMKYSSFTESKAIKDLFTNNDRLYSIDVFCAPSNYNSKIDGITFHTRDLSLLSCGKVGINHFTPNIHHFNESIRHNSCLNRKVSIDASGNIKNCPSMKKSFGNIKDTTLEEALEKPGFKKYWDINKDKIHVCKDCEFRYICTDCRAYVEDPKDILSKPLKCGYNPYTGEWSEWSSNPLKQKAIDFYSMPKSL